MTTSFPPAPRRHRTTRRALVAAVAAAGLGVAGCGSDDDDPVATSTQPATTSAAAAPAGAVAAELRGTYERRVTRADIARTAKIRDESGPNQHVPPPGVKRLVIDGAKLRVEDPAPKPPVVVEQSITATGDQLAIEAYIRPERGSFCGPEIPQNATYRWARDGAVLRLEAVGDTCADRDSLLTGDWTPSTG